MNRILVASDLSARSDRALERAMELARRLDLPVTLLHVVDEALPLAAIEALVEAATLELSGALHRLDPEEKLAVSLRVVAGEDHRTIVELAQSEDAGLIVLGTHRNEASDFFFVGTTVERVVRESPVPVLVVKGRVKGPYAHVVVGIDFSVYAPAAVSGARNLAADAKLRLVHAFSVPFPGFLSSKDSAEQVREARRRKLSRLIEHELHAFADASNRPEDRRVDDVVPGGGAAALAVREKEDAAGPQPNIEARVVEGEVHSALRRQVCDMQADLIVLGTHGQVGTGRRWLGSVAETFLVRPPCDVLVVKAW